MYNFDRTKPPLLRNIYNVRSVPESELRADIGKADWRIVEDEVIDPAVPSPYWIPPSPSPYPPPFPVPAPQAPPALRMPISDFKAVRYYFWTIAAPPIHLTSPRQDKVTETRGYTKTQKESFQATVGIGFKGNGKPSLIPSVNAQLKFSQEVSETWKEESVHTVDQTFAGNSTHITWILLDILVTQKTYTVWWRGKHNGPDFWRKDPVTTEARLEAVDFIYQDAVEDGKGPAPFPEILGGLWPTSRYANAALRVGN